MALVRDSARTGRSSFGDRPRAHLDEQTKSPFPQANREGNSSDGARRERSHGTSRAFVAVTVFQGYRAILTIMVETSAFSNHRTASRHARGSARTGRSSFRQAHIEEIGNLPHFLPGLWAAAIAFFVELGLDLEGETRVEGRWADRVVDADPGRPRLARELLSGVWPPADVAASSPLGSTVEVAAPNGLARLSWSTFPGQEGDSRQVVEDINARYSGAALNETDERDT